MVVTLVLMYRHWFQSKRAGKRPTPANQTPRWSFPPQVNQAVRLDLESVYIAVPKCGTTSIRKQFSPSGPFLVDKPHLTIREVESFFQTWHLMKNLGANHTFPTDSSLVKSDFEIVAEAKKRFDNLTKFATVRNPFARTISLYRRREGPPMSEKMSFDEFCEKLQFASDTCGHPSRSQCQVDWLVDWDGKSLLVDNVLRLESIAEDLKDFRQRHPQLAFLEVSYKNVNPLSDAQDYRAVYSSSARNSVEELFKRDFDAFNYDF